jgi:UDP-N-acetylmuramate dehydrogenase
VSSARDPAVAAALREVVNGEVREDEPLSRWSTYRIGGPATVLLPAHAEDVATALRFVTERGLPWFALGLGSNLLFPDSGLDALVIRLGKGVDRLVQAEDRWTLGAGLPAPLAAKRTAAAGWGGIHKMVGVPGSVGGGVVMNAGCHGAEWCDVVERLLVVDPTGVDRQIMAADAGFRYRGSTLGQVIVLETIVRLQQADTAALVRETEALFQWRREGTPFQQPCCGSVFQNPQLPDGWEATSPRTSGQFLDAAGCKGVRVGEAQVSTLHANYIVNLGGATAADVQAVMREVRARVADRWSVALQPEVKLIQPDGTVGML